MLEVVNKVGAYNHGENNKRRDLTNSVTWPHSLM